MALTPTAISAAAAMSKSERARGLHEAVRPHLALEEGDAADGPLHLLSGEDFLGSAGREIRLAHR